MFDHIIGNEPIKAYFSKAFESNTLPTAMIISGLPGLGKTLFAHALAQKLLMTNKIETHPDFHSLKPESKSGLHSIESFRHLIDEVQTSAYQNCGKVFIIFDADRMQTASANAILKTLEEPNPDTTLILITEELNAILPTIRSRCASIALKPIREDLIASYLMSNNLDPKWAKLSFGSIGKAVELATKPLLEQPIFDLLASRPIYPKFLQELEKIEASIDDEDPVKKNQNVARLLTAVLIWYRDQYAHKLGGALYFSDNKPVDFFLPTIATVAAIVEEARINYQRNIKLSACLEHIFSHL
ncbi:MAG TPA: AAA family ATPase [Chlamydiales bacterium]|nr:AAA family ATPase [Chlamydiales bacterium]